MIIFIIEKKKEKKIQVQSNYPAKLFLKMVLSSKSNLTGIYLFKVKNKALEQDERHVQSQQYRQ